MKIQYCSDLHLEFKENNRFIKSHPLIPSADILILAGDILPFTYLKNHNSFIDHVADQFAMVYWLPGNHEYYGSDLLDKPFELQEKIRDNVMLVNNTSIMIDGTSFIYSTLWSEISTVHDWNIRQTLSDFHAIRFDQKPFTTFDYNSLHKQSRFFLESALEDHKMNRKVVVTHHVPTLFHYPEQYITSDIREAFSVELYDLIESAEADYWIYGHHHCNVPAFTVGKTQLVTNQLGYVSNQENLEFKRDVVIDV